MELTETLIPARSERRSWTGHAIFSLSGVSHLKIKSPGVDHLDLQVSNGETYRIEISVNIEKI